MSLPNQIFHSYAISGTSVFFEEKSIVFQALQSGSMLINSINIHNQTFCLGTHAHAQTAETKLATAAPIHSCLQGYCGGKFRAQIQTCLSICSQQTEHATSPPK